MANTAVVNTSVTIAGKTISGQSVITDEGLDPVIDASSGSAATDKEYTCSFPYQRLKMLVIKCTVDAVLDFNSTSEPAPSIAVAAGKPFIYDSTQPYASPFTENITKLYLTTAAAYGLQVYGVYDPTP